MNHDLKGSFVVLLEFAVFSPYLTPVKSLTGRLKWSDVSAKC